MSNLADFLNEVSDDSQNATNQVGGFIGFVADLAGAISGVTDFFSWFAHLGQPSNDSVQNALNKLQASVDAGKKATDTGVSALGMQANFQAVDSVVDPARAIFGSLPIIDPKDETSVTDSIEKCYTALISLRDDVESKWTVPFADGAASYTDPWSGNVFPPHTDLMFSYTYALPQFIRSIGFFLTVIAALKPSALSDYTADLTQCVERLQLVHDKIVSEGLVGTKIPVVNDVEFVHADGALEELGTNWTNGSGYLVYGNAALWPFGAVERFSGASIVDSYWPFLPYTIDPWFPENFFRLLELRIEDRKKKLFTQLGLPVIRKTIKLLQTIIGQPVSTAQPYEAWSLRNALRILGVSLNGSGTFRSLMAFLKGIPPYKGGLLFPPQGGSTYPPSPLPKSFRGLFVPS